MKHVLAMTAFALSSAAAQPQSPQHVVFVKNCSVVAECASLAGSPLPIAPNFQPQIQIFITEFGAVPEGYSIVLNYTDAGGQRHSVNLPLVTANAPFFPGYTVTLVTIAIQDITGVTAVVIPVGATGGSY